MTRAKRERKEKAKAEANAKRASDRERHEREAFAKKLEEAKKAAHAVPASGIAFTSCPARGTKSARRHFPLKPIRRRILRGARHDVQRVRVPRFG